jgi:hypothetical protein
VDCGPREAIMAPGGARRGGKLLVLLSLDVGNQKTVRSKKHCRHMFLLKKEGIGCGEMMMFYNILC